MNTLRHNEILDINGGCASSSDPAVQAGMNVGCAIGRAIGNTIRQFGEFAKALNPFK